MAKEKKITIKFEQKEYKNNNAFGHYCRVIFDRKTTSFYIGENEKQISKLDKYYSELKADIEKFIRFESEYFSNNYSLKGLNKRIDIYKTDVIDLTFLGTTLFEKLKDLLTYNQFLKIEEGYYVEDKFEENQAWEIFTVFSLYYYIENELNLEVKTLLGADFQKAVIGFMQLIDFSFEQKRISNFDWFSNKNIQNEFKIFLNKKARHFTLEKQLLQLYNQIPSLDITNYSTSDIYKALNFHLKEAFEKKVRNTM